MNKQNISKLRLRDMELIEHLKDDNLSLRYQVEKLQLALKKVLLVEKRHRLHASMEEFDENRRMQEHIQKLEAFVDDNANETMALRGRLKGASTYISKLEDDRSRLSEEVQSLRAEVDSANSTPAGPSKTSPGYSLRNSTNGIVRDALESVYSKRKPGDGEVGELVASNLATVFAKAQTKQSESSILDSGERKQRRKSKVLHKRKLAQKESKAAIKTSPTPKSMMTPVGKDYSNAAFAFSPQTTSPMTLTNEEFVYIMNEVASLKLKMSQTEAQLRSVAVDTPLNAAKESIKDDLREMKQSQGILMEQVKGQQEALSQIVKLVSTMSIPSTGDSGDMIDEELAYRNKHMSQATVRGRTFNRYPSKEKKSVKVNRQERKLALLNAGYSCAQIDDDLLLEKLLDK